MSPVREATRAASACFPRASGDEPLQKAHRAQVATVFPARAGMSPCGSRCTQPTVRFPRASGDEPREREQQRGYSTFSPRERG